MIANTFIKRPVTAMVISIVITAVGLISLLNLPIAQYPNITPPQVTIAGQFTGADAETVEQTTTTAIETQVNGTPGMTYIQSTSTSDGRANINVNFEVGTDIDIATLDVQNRVSVAEPTLPDAVKRLGLTVRKRNPGIRCRAKCHPLPRPFQKSQRSCCFPFGALVPLPSHQNQHQ